MSDKPLTPLPPVIRGNAFAQQAALREAAAGHDAPAAPGAPVAHGRYVRYARDILRDQRQRESTNVSLGSLPEIPLWLPADFADHENASSVELVVPQAPGHVRPAHEAPSTSRAVRDSLMMSAPLDSVSRGSASSAGSRQRRQRTSNAGPSTVEVVPGPRQTRSTSPEDLRHRPQHRPRESENRESGLNPARLRLDSPEITMVGDGSFLPTRFGTFARVGCANIVAGRRVPSFSGVIEQLDDVEPPPSPVLQSQPPVPGPDVMSEVTERLRHLKGEVEILQERITRLEGLVDWVAPKP